MRTSRSEAKRARKERSRKPASRDQVIMPLTTAVQGPTELSAHTSEQNGSGATPVLVRLV